MTRDGGSTGMTQGVGICEGMRKIGWDIISEQGLGRVMDRGWEERMRAGREENEGVGIGQDEGAGIGARDRREGLEANVGRVMGKARASGVREDVRRDVGMEGRAGGERS